MEGDMHSSALNSPSKESPSTPLISKVLARVLDHHSPFNRWVTTSIPLFKSKIMISHLFLSLMVLAATKLFIYLEKRIQGSMPSLCFLLSLGLKTKTTLEGKWPCSTLPSMFWPTFQATNKLSILTSTTHGRQTLLFPRIWPSLPILTSIEKCLTYKTRHRSISKALICPCSQSLEDRMRLDAFWPRKSFTPSFKWRKRTR